MSAFSKQEILAKIQNEIIVSCQAYEPNPLASIEDMVKMARCAEMGGCAGFRVNHPDCVKAIRQATSRDKVIIGIWKIMTPGNSVYITPTMDAVDALVEAGADIVALDCTDRYNAEGIKGFDLVKKVKVKYPDLVLMADCATCSEAKTAKEAGVDIISSTLAGYTEQTKQSYTDGPDFELLKELSEIIGVHVIAEGRLWTREEALKAFEVGANTIVIGTAITNPVEITKRFVKAKEDYFKE